MSSYILGVHAGHNASVTIGDAHGLRFSIQEERLCGEKNYWGLPRLALQRCLDEVGAGPEDVAVVAYGGQQVLSRYHSRDDVLKAYRRQEGAMGRLRQRVAMPLALALSPRYGQQGFVRFLNEVGLGHAERRFYPHHQAHAATAYYGLREDPERPYLLLTADGSGDNVSATVGVMGGGRSEWLARTDMGSSLGAIYSWVTYMLGFVPLEHEYKLMGMAPYAPEAAAREVAQIFHSYLALSDDGLSFQRRRARTNDLLQRLYADLRGRRFDYICAGLQRFTEDILTGWAARAVEATGVDEILAAGGVFMNVKANQAIAALPGVRSFQAYPSCGDESLSHGAYFLAAAERYGDAEVPGLSNYYLGDAPSEAACEAAIQAASGPHGLRYERPDDLPAAVAELLASGEPLARCAGPMEFGARALGNRSILADPSNPDVVRVINRMVKKRDFWMPFAPMMKAERAGDYIQNPKGLKSPYMMMTFDATERYRELIAAVHGADLTCRAQLLERPQNPEMHDIISAFEVKTGRGVVLNTSFNLHGFPIVRTPEEALHVLTHSGLRHLQLGPFLVHKA